MPGHARSFLHWRLICSTEMPALHLDTPVKFLKGIGERRAEGLERLGISTAQDLLWHLPHRYVDASSVTPLVKASVGSDVACVGRVVAKGILPTRRGLRIFHAVLRDASGALECVWPGQAFLEAARRGRCGPCPAAPLPGHRSAAPAPPLPRGKVGRRRRR